MICSASIWCVYTDSSGARSRSPHLQLNVYQSFMTITAFCYLLAWSGTAPELPTKFKHTLHTELVQVTTAADVAGGEDAEEPDTST